MSSSSVRGQRMVQGAANGWFKSHIFFLLLCPSVSGEPKREVATPQPRRPQEPRAADGEGFSEGHAEDFGALVLRAAVEIRSGRPKPACRRNIPRRSAAGRGNSTRS